MNNSIFDKNNEYFSEKLKLYGATAAGVDWNSEESQNIRFKQFSKIFDTPESNFSVCDFGCGYGAFLEFLAKDYPKIQYTGFDINSEMISEAKRLFHHHFINPTWVSESILLKKYDYTIACGVLNIKLSVKEEEWIEHVKQTLFILDSITTKTFAFNILTSYSDKDKMKDYLYYADPCFWFDFCKRNFSKNVALLHDYGVYEFSIVVKK